MILWLLSYLKLRKGINWTMFLLLSLSLSFLSYFSFILAISVKNYSSISSPNPTNNIERAWLEAADINLVTCSLSSIFPSVNMISM